MEWFCQRGKPVCVLQIPVAETPGRANRCRSDSARHPMVRSLVGRGRSSNAKHPVVQFSGKNKFSESAGSYAHDRGYTHQAKVGGNSV